MQLISYAVKSADVMFLLIICILTNGLNYISIVHQDQLAKTWYFQYIKTLILHVRRMKVK